MHPRGQPFEEQAERLLQCHGLSILERNYSARTGEIDIIATEGDVLVFVEVRARSHRRFGGAAKSVDKKKQRRLILTAQHYLQRHNRGIDRRCRFDVIAFEPRQSGAGRPVHWFRGAFTAEQGNTYQ
jgi:putative endonuclease